MSTIDRELLSHLVLLATRAPSIHNTQPWRLERRNNGLEVWADRQRQLAVLDPEGRQLTISCGAMVHHLEVAARGMGLEPTLEVLPDPEQRDLLAVIHLATGHVVSEDEVARSVDILHRHTARTRFTSEQLPFGLTSRLRSAVEQFDAMLRILRPDEAVGVAVLVDEAEAELRRMPGYLKELGAWVWPADRIDLRPDGLPREAVEPGPDRAQEVRGRDFVDGPPDRSEHPGPAEHPTLVLLTTEQDSPLDWLQAGRALSALLLQAAHEGVAAQPLGQVSDLASTRVELRRRLGIVGVPQMLLRLGHDESRLQTPRRPVEEILGEPR
jgi:hypothetical protein